MRSPLAPVLPLALASASLLALPGCPPSEPNCTNTVLPVCAPAGDPYSDEACNALDDTLARTPNPPVDAMRGPVVDAPGEAATLPGGAPFTFRWTGQLVRRAPGARPAAYAQAAPRAPTLGDELRRFFTLVPPAYAHCDPFNGIGYALLFRVNGHTVLRVEQSTTAYTPDAAAWQTLRGAGGPIDLTILATRFGASRVTEGPYASPTRRFTIGN